MNDKFYDFLPDEEVSLKPCPFCGGDAELYGIFVPTVDDEINVYVCGCRRCSVKFEQAWQYDKIVSRWNTRY